MEQGRSKRGLRRVTAGIWLLVFAVALAFRVDAEQKMGPEYAGPIVAVQFIESPVSDEATVTSRFIVLPGRHDQRVWLAGLGSPDSVAPIELALALDIESGVLGPMARVLLEGPPGLFREGTPVRKLEVPGAGTMDSYELRPTAFLSPGKAYVATLSVDLDRGVAAIRVASEDGRDVIVEGHLWINPLRSPLYPGRQGGIEDQAVAGPGGVTFSAFSVEPVFKRLGPPLLLSANEFRLEVEPVGSPGRLPYPETPLWVTVQGGRASAPGVFDVVAVGADGGETSLWRGDLPPGGELILEKHALTPGHYTIVLRYVEPDFEVDIASRPLAVIAAAVESKFTLVPADGAATRSIVGHLIVKSDRALPDLAVRLVSSDRMDASIKREVWRKRLTLLPGEPVEVRFAVPEELVPDLASFIWEYETGQLIDVQEEIDIYTVAVIEGPIPAKQHPSEFGSLVMEALKREGIVARMRTPDAFVSEMRGGRSPYRAVIISPWVLLSPEFEQAISAFAKLGGDLVLLGDAGISLARIDSSIGLPIFSPHEPYALYELKDVAAVEPTQAYSELGLGPAFDAGYGGVLEGHSAVGYVYPRASRYWPVLSAKDRHGRVRGWAAGVLVHHGGPYARGHWLISGVTSPPFYTDEAFAQLTAGALALFRSGKLMERAVALDEAKEHARVAFVAQAPAPMAAVRVSDDGTHLVSPSGEAFFMIGANYAGPFGHGFGFGRIDVDAIRADFEKAKWAGINAFRIWGAADAGPKLKSVLSDMARRYGIHLLIVLPHPSEMATDEEYLARVKRIVRTWADEPMVIGYDLANEPDIQRIGGIRYGGEPTPILALKPFESYRSLLDRRRIEEEVRENAYPGNPSHTTYEENLHLRAARDLWLGEVAGSLTRRGRDYSTFSLYAGRLDAPAALDSLHDAVEATFAQWIGRLKEAIREIAPHQLVTVGYDQPYALLEANEVLDFVNHHVYQRPTAFAEVEKNLTTMDRLRLRWPAKPVSYGEFGYSSGYPMPDGDMLDPYTAAVGEIMFYLDGFAKGYSGAMIWLLNERPIANMRHNESWMRGPDLRYEERLGVFYYDGDGTLRGKPKPIAHAIRFFAEWAKRHAPGVGDFLLKPSATRIGAGYEFRAVDALFVGDVSYASPGLAFRGEDAANVMLRWDDETLEVMATADVTVRLAPSHFGSGLTGGGIVVEGKHGGWRQEGAVFVIDLLEGETVTFRNELVSFSSWTPGRLG